MGKLKQLKEQRATIFSQIDELRKATDGREMNAEERQRWDALIADYDRADQAVETEERFVDIERRQVEAHHHRVQGTTNDQKEAEYRSAFTDYLLHGVTGI